MSAGENARRAGLAVRPSPGLHEVTFPCWSPRFVIRKRRNVLRHFEIVQGEHLRVELRAIDFGEQMGPIEHDGEMLLTCVDGAVMVTEHNERFELLRRGDQAFIPRGSVIDLECVEEGTIELVWSPPALRGPSA